jgi:hypothetical protein
VAQVRHDERGPSDVDGPQPTVLEQVDPVSGHADRLAELSLAHARLLSELAGLMSQPSRDMV